MLSVMAACVKVVGDIYIYQKVNSHYNIYCFIHTEFHRCLVLSPSMRVIQFPCAEQGLMS